MVLQWWLAENCRVKSHRCLDHLVLCWSLLLLGWVLNGFVVFKAESQQGWGKLSNFQFHFYWISSNVYRMERKILQARDRERFLLKLRNMQRSSLLVTPAFILSYFLLSVLHMIRIKLFGPTNISLSFDNVWAKVFYNQPTIFDHPKQIKKSRFASLEMTCWKRSRSFIILSWSIVQKSMWDDNHMIAISTNNL